MIIEFDGQRYAKKKYLSNFISSKFYVSLAQVMAGIYIHIPFCKTRCNYCDFFSSTSMNKKTQYIEALCKELELRKDYLQGEEIQTIYFGGGTPSQFAKEDFEKIFNHISLGVVSDAECKEKNLPLPPPKWDMLNHQHPLSPSGGGRRRFSCDKEITLEANPDDITPQYLESLKDLPFNRISIGIQSFNDEELRFLNRRHNAQKAIEAVKNCRNYGFSNISIDLIYGLPCQNMQIWKDNLKQALELCVQHISAYHLIYEKGTKLYNLLEQGKITPIDEALSVEMFSEMIDILEENGFEHYEISNFAKSGFISQHNSSYWNGTHYLGIGASAHSFNGQARHWNVPDIDVYIETINQGKLPAETEIIGESEAYNDFILTRMRTMKGLNLSELKDLFGENKEKYCFAQAQKHIQNQTVKTEENYLKLTRKGIFISDGIMSDLFL